MGSDRYMEDVRNAPHELSAACVTIVEMERELAAARLEIERLTSEQADNLALIAKTTEHARELIAQRDVAMRDAFNVRCRLADEQDAHQATREMYEKSFAENGELLDTLYTPGGSHETVAERNVARSERDFAYALNERLQGDIDKLRRGLSRRETENSALHDRLEAVTVERELLRAEVERMRPVVDAAVKQANRNDDDCIDMFLAVDVYCVAASDAYRAAKVTP